MTGFVDAKYVVDVVYLDFSKAFVTLSHNILDPHWDIVARTGERWVGEILAGLFV